MRAGELADRHLMGPQASDPIRKTFRTITWKMLERSYRMLAESEAVLEHSLKLEQKLGKPG